ENSVISRRRNCRARRADNRTMVSGCSERPSRNLFRWPPVDPSKQAPHTPAARRAACYAEHEVPMSFQARVMTTVLAAFFALSSAACTSGWEEESETAYDYQGDPPGVSQATAPVEDNYSQYTAQTNGVDGAPSDVAPQPAI